MSMILVGLNHRTAPIALREQLALSGEKLREALAELKGEAVPLHEVVILSTCNRLEIYATADDSGPALQWLDHYLAKLKDIELDELFPALYHLAGRDVIEHLMRVSSGLDSMILGEPQILGQVNQAFGEAHAAGTTGAVLARFFTQAVHAGKRARTETEISQHTTSVSHAAVRLAKHHVGNLEDLSALIVGAGEMAKLAAEALVKYNPRAIHFINRTCARAEEMACEIGGTAVHWHELLPALTHADVVIASTGAPHPVIFAEELQEILPLRQGRPLLIVDIAVPRDIDEAVDDLDGVILYDIDDLNHVLDENMAHRQASAIQVEKIIDEETNDFIEWMQSREVVPVIVELRQKLAEIAEAEVQLALNRLGDLDDNEQKVIDKLAHRIVNKVLYEPTKRLKEQAIKGKGPYYAECVAQLFDLDAPLPVPIEDFVVPTSMSTPQPISLWVEERNNN